jgi:hypothetical protein
LCQDGNLTDGEAALNSDGAAEVIACGPLEPIAPREPDSFRSEA